VVPGEADLGPPSDAGERARLNAVHVVPSADHEAVMLVPSDTIRR
jgi:hypothetical protein